MNDIIKTMARAKCESHSLPWERNRASHERWLKEAAAELAALKSSGYVVVGWQPIETYDTLKKKPRLAVFRFKPVPKRNLDLKEAFQFNRIMGNRVCTHWMSLPAPLAHEGEG